jgi:hypothetical protein
MSDTKIHEIGNPHLEPLYAAIPQALDIAGFRRAKLYSLIGDGLIRAVKCGSRTLIDLKSLREYLETLPAAKIKPQGRRELYKRD